ncbi:hypothetical protein JCM10207_005604 [Rhodosporidiobolus poonsookiae]
MLGPFKQSRAGRKWPPKVLKPEEIVFHFQTQASLPLNRYTFEQIDLFSNVTSLSFHSCRLESAFIPLFIGPGPEARSQLKDLELLSCADTVGRPREVYECVLSFLLEVIVLSEDAFPSLHFPSDAPRLLDKRGILHGNDDDDKQPIGGSREDWEGWEVELDWSLFIETAHDDYPFFLQFWVERGYASPDISAWTHECPFLALRTLALQLTNTGQLYLIFYTSSFPSLRTFTASSLWCIHADAQDFATLRYSITRPPGTFLPPRVWSPHDLHHLSDALPAPLEPDMSIPPLTSAERDTCAHGT